MEATKESSARQLERYIPLLVCCAFWPVWRWYALRSVDASDEPWGLLALLSFAIFIIKDKSAKSIGSYSPLSPTALWMVGIFVAIHIAVFNIAPNLVQAFLFVAALSSILFSPAQTSPSSPRSRAGMIGLLVLALPILPSLNFFAGYPMRAGIATAAAFMLRFFGLSASPNGAMLTVSGHTISIDAPCSGVNMLWAALYISLMACTFFRLKAWKVICIVASAVMTTLLANVLRIAMLAIFAEFTRHSRQFALESFEPSVHVAAGVFVFLVVVASVIACTFLLRPDNSSNDTQRSEPQYDFQPPKSPRWLKSGICALSLAAAVCPFFPQSVRGHLAPSAPPVWPTTIMGRAITPVAALEEEVAFAKNFPGTMRRFSDGTSAYFVRFVTSDTRQLHSSRDCFKGMGYDVEPAPMLEDSDGTRWSSFAVSKNGHDYIVREQIRDISNRHQWTDVSEWYWNAALKRSAGPWFAITIASPAQPPQAQP